MYKIIGSDNREYGPVTLDQLRQWLAEGRVNDETRVRAEGQAEWRPLATLGLNLGSAPAPSVPSPYPQPLKTNGMAIAGLVMGILSLIQCCCFVFGILGIIFSGIALSQINKRPTEFTGRGMAVAGLVMSILGLIINVALVIFYWAAIMAGTLLKH